MIDFMLSSSKHMNVKNGILFLTSFFILHCSRQEYCEHLDVECKRIQYEVPFLIPGPVRYVSTESVIGWTCQRCTNMHIAY